jgi:hypothetical protein
MTALDKLNNEMSNKTIEQIPLWLHYRNRIIRFSICNIYFFARSYIFIALWTIFFKEVLGQAQYIEWQTYIYALGSIVGITRFGIGNNCWFYRLYDSKIYAAIEEIFPVQDS